jgi:hypothetical protein
MRLLPYFVRGASTSRCRRCTRRVAEIGVHDGGGGRHLLVARTLGIEGRAQDRGGGLGRERVPLPAQVVGIVAAIELARVRRDRPSLAPAFRVRRSTQFRTAVICVPSAVAIGVREAVLEACIACPMRT